MTIAEAICKYLWVRVPVDLYACLSFETNGESNESGHVVRTATHLSVPINTLCLKITNKQARDLLLDAFINIQTLLTRMYF